ncbi:MULTISPECIES: selenocysteine-specific translation elongation factor [Stenotrophomonas]|jgi:selenocysteine-specific elongation factor|uniref:Selenocysteine-specific elongation factor n=1 Tax=Stenotrophomonas pavanii TaxID=487698 RepID=A0A246KZF4_9GAMM|nr:MULTISPECIES: selenocysteine-specific translation elongation factor [Stenotrophomonas]MBC9079620.1 selenocysteine-specific translation elongation factor [Stenotrophomonas maltophilia]MBC9093059.1 selenocysteine-specific translation elongation factor [Stenotrophomonas maltophilia]MBH1388854.1 selenocysteine-specific translation elongation factor [Stenotrophomonas maltophilia]MBH1520504.1 selenocysteine-specific translation elongation factor [Stenotrophomonas maltophilia]MCF3464862.1 selenocy
MIVGTAGHIDHGKTRLVRALTGIETDRLQEERTRGISIELGYAYVPVEGSVGDASATLGFVDVPGHERFVHTMVAGATGIDMALLVIAADDGVMPQTREHLAILQLLGVDRGAVALTKIDRVDAARMAQVQTEIAALLAGTPLQDAPVFACNSTSPDDVGINALRTHLHACATDEFNARRAALHHELFRMPVDRVFSLAGHGTLVTGAVHGGVASVGEHLQLMPAATDVRVRSIHAQNRASERAMAGQRCALNLAAIAREDIHRGDWIADPRALLATLRVDVRLRISAQAAPLRDWAPLHIHWGTMHRQAHLVLLEDAPSGDGQLVQLVFDSPVCAMCGDRFIARDSAATHTLGGGIVLDPEPPQRRRRSPARLAWLRALEQLAAGAGLGPLLQQAPLGIPMATLQRYCRRAADRIDLPADTRRIVTREDTVVILASHWQVLREQVIASLRSWHERRPDEPGVDSGRLQRSTLPALATGLWNALLQDLLADGTLQRVGAWWRLPGHDHAPPERERLLLERVLPHLHAGGFDPPWVRTLATDFGLPEDEVRAILRRAAARGELFQVVPDLFYAPARIAELAAIVARLSQASGTVDAAAFRDAIGLGRKRSIQILEFFNRVGYTRRVGDQHRPRGDLQWNAAHD